MEYERFIINYVRTHSSMTEDELLSNIPVAWERHLNPPVHDVYAYWMSDTMMILGTDRMMRNRSV